MSTIILTQYNNYFNRVIKTLYDALDYYGSNAKTFTDVNFNPQDGVNTKLTINWDESFTPDYLVECDTNNEIMSRWFIHEMDRNRAGQYELTLRRDLVSDHRVEVMNSICFIEKGWVDSSNPLIFNPEGVTVNKIQTDEILLRDSTKAAWIVGYVAPNLANFNTENGTSTAVNELTIDISYPQETIPDISTFEYSEYIGTQLKGLVNNATSRFQIRGAHKPNEASCVEFYFNGANQIIQKPIAGTLSTDTSVITLFNTHPQINPMIFSTLLENNISNDTFAAIMGLKDKVYVDNGVYKKLTFTTVQKKESVFYPSSVDYPNIIQTVKNAFSNQQITLTDNTLAVIMNYEVFTPVFEEVAAPFTTGKLTFKSSNRQLYDAPYKMFCIPLTPVEAIVKVGENALLTTKDKMLQIASSIATGLGSNLYDIQLLPYCPIEDQFATTSNPMRGIEYLGGTVDIDYSVMTDNEQKPIGYLFWCPRASFTTNIKTSFTAYPDLNYNDPLEFKVGNESTYMRLVAPNYANYEDINYYMNYGIDYINIDCTYKPITPYIKLNINYKGLYGKDFDNNRGLVLGGDYSLPIMSDAWVNYQIQNKNYSNIFDRETQHLEYQQGWKTAAAITGAIGGTAQGALMGRFLSPGNGGLIGGIGAAGAGLADIMQTVGGFHESMDYRRDNYQMQLQNIQAIPQGLVKTSAFNYNSKLWPMIEIYHCTETEKELLRNKIRYSGMTINAIGKLSDYLNPNGQTYIQGKIIRIDIGDEYHLTKELNNELKMGVYI